MIRKTFSLKTNQPFNSEEIYSKGVESYEIDVNDIESSLSHLSAHSNTRINEAPKEFEEFVNTVNVLYNTEFYPVVYDLITKYFSPDEVIPGTVKAYMAGCLNNPSPCSSTCAGSAPATTEFTPCEHKVVIAVEEEKFLFTVTHSADSSKALVYVAYDCYEDFSGFSEEDLLCLKNLGITEAKLMGNKDTQLCDFLPLEELKKKTKKEAAVPQLVNTVQYPQNIVNNNWVYWIILGIIILLVLIFLFYRFWRK